jgi:hypothetical protein
MNLEIMLAPGPTKNELVVELDPEQEKLVVKGIKGRNHELARLSMVLRVARCQYTGDFQNVALKIHFGKSMQL